METTVKTGTATHIGGRSAQADAVHAHTTPLGTAVAVVDGIGSAPEVCAATPIAAATAARTACHRGAKSGILAAADTMPDHDNAPDAVAAVISVGWDRRIEVAHVGDAAAYTWSTAGGLRRWTADQTAGEHIRHMMTNPGLDDDARAALAALEAGLSVMDDYLLATLAGATPAMVSAIALADEDADVVEVALVLSDGVHKQLDAARIEHLVRLHADRPQALADALVADAVAVDGSDNATAGVIALN